MREFLTKNKKVFSNLLLILIVSFLGVFVFKVHSARAQGGILIDWAFEGLCWAFARIGAILQSIFSILFWLASMLFEIAFRLSGFTTAGVVQVGWRLTRDLVNMFFVLALLFIAFAMILHQEQFGAKKMLPRLIIVALLINFSLPLCGVVIDASQVITDFFVNETLGGGTISEQLAGILHVQQISELNPEANIPEKLATGTGGLIMVIFSIFLGILLLLAATVAIGLGAFFLISRLIAIWILLILAPLAWFAWIFPGKLGGYAKEWWEEFLKWVFFAPIYTFFIWLAIKAGQAGAFSGIINQEIQNIVAAKGFTSTVGVMLVSSPVLFLQFILIIGILFYGLKTALKTGAAGAKTVMDWRNAAVGGISGWAGAKAIGAAARPFGAATGAAANILGKVPGFRRIAAEPLRTASEASRAKSNTIIDNYKKKYANWTENNLKSRFRVADPREKVAIAQILASRGNLNPTETLGFTERSISDSLQIAERYERHSDILKTRPDLVRFISEGERIDEDTRRLVAGLAPKDMENLQSISLGSYSEAGEFQSNPDQARVLETVRQQLTARDGRWGVNHLTNLYRNNPNTLEIVQREVIEGVNLEDLRANRPEIARYLESAPGRAIFGERAGAIAEARRAEAVIANPPTQAEFQQARREGYRGR